MLVLFWTGLMPSSIGVVTKRSTSSALLPFHWVMMVICVLVTSGNASMGMLLKLMKPAIAKIPTQIKVNALFLMEKAMIFLMNLFIRVNAKTD